MGICVARMERDIAGALGPHRVAGHYMNPAPTPHVIGLIRYVIIKDLEDRCVSSSMCIVPI